MLGKSIYYVNKNVTVVNNIKHNTNKDDVLMWARALGAVSSDSIILCNKHKEVLYLNDRYGSFSKYKIFELPDVIEVLSKGHSGLPAAEKAVQEIFSYFVPISFDLFDSISNKIVRCKGVPVLTGGGGISGVVFSAHKEVCNGSRSGISGKDSNRTQPKQAFFGTLLGYIGNVADFNRNDGVQGG